MSRYRTRIQWTETALNCLKKLPLKVRRGLLEKADELLGADDPRAAGIAKRLRGPLASYYSLKYSRYRAVYCVHEDEPPDETTFLTLRVLFVAAGIRREGDQDDVYRVAQRLVALGVLPVKPQTKRKPHTK